jgi:4-hydroxy-3-methylbut-2-enyl diphosphate reductase IspH
MPNRPKANPAESDVANAAVWKAQYTAAKDKAQTVFKKAKTTCNSLEGDAKGSCMKNATTARTDALAQAKTQWDSHIKMDGRPARPTKGDLDRPTGDKPTEAKKTQ